jgi:hypothetical protein
MLDSFFDYCTGKDLVLEWGTKGLSIRLPTSDRPEPLSVGWAYPTQVAGWLGLRDLTLGVDESSAASRPSVAAALRQYLEGLKAIPDARPARPQPLDAYTFSSATAVANAAAINDALSRLVEAVAEGA